MQIVSAMLPEPPESQDRVFATPNAAIVLDGASPFVPVEVPTGRYVDTLGGRLRSRILDDPEVDLQDALADAIEFTKAELDLHPGESPSSTVAIARERGDNLDLLVLGDTQIATPHGILRDDRLGAVAVDERRAYQDRLRAGHGYDGEHRALLRALQRKQARHRNRFDGYWIAESDSSAAQSVMTQSVPNSDSTWAALATDGAYRPLEHTRRNDWEKIAIETEKGVQRLLLDLQAFERKDITGREYPRAKPHDDKTICILRHENTLGKARVG